MTLTDEMKAQGWREIHEVNNEPSDAVLFELYSTQGKIIKGRGMVLLSLLKGHKYYRRLTPVIPAQIGLSPMLGKLRNIV